ncbi:MAG: ABC transporter permease [Deltaproteobacteria bacterium]|nr:ABC transporter permease [Deltaproteobacteria bacterium]MBW2130163.1 ABC transporter permease [Deltaproteobacteria bacterium]
MRLVRVIERLLGSIPVILGVLIIVFFFMRLLPGDPVEIMLGDSAASISEMESLRQELHLDEPLPKQLWLFISGLFQGDLGYSVVKRQPVLELILETIPPTVELTLAAVFMAILIALPVGVLTSLRPGSIFDRATMSGALLGISMPNFWLGLILILVFCVHLGWFPTSGRLGSDFTIARVTGFLTLDAILTGNWAAFRDAVKHLLIPATTLGVAFAAVLARVIRSSMLEVMRMEYVTAARAKGVPETAVIIKHALRNAMIPAVTVAGLEVGKLLGGNMIVETIFSWPGLGRLVVSSIFSRDYVVVQSAVMLYALTYVMANLTVDVVYTYLNPKIEL